MKLILTATAALALLGAPLIASTDATEDLAAAATPATAPACFKQIEGTNTFQRTGAEGCIYYSAPTDGAYHGNDPDHDVDR
ncbi:hypothetical protein DSD19_06125 [Rhodovulum sp. BSW8]|uniref:hypothetical protein n=1 Tax=Rhodovulum sp. BSW8 TaxID=2259645 RepID=UPI000DE367B8|nr:hypothetical protein [Rhodovulum sp. BSW8]RBO54037.1 hypothetical protein DSD19_06125 [Rhodovulum sp. BSW8]